MPADAHGAGDIELVVFAGDKRAAFPLPERGSVIIGRGADCDVCIDDPSVSRRHAALHVGPALRIEDMGSANGTSVRDPRHPPEGAETHRLRRRPGEVLEVALGDCIVLGSTLAVVRRRASAPPAPGTGAGRRAGGDEVVVLEPAMQALYAQARLAAASDIRVLLLGETGVGKEVLAREVHRISRRAAGPFLAFNCAALPASLLEGELFGHERGAFTGAVQGKPGLLEAASGGTVLLDEVGELEEAAQVKLLRALEESEVLRVGGRAPRPIDVRFIAATHRDLEADAERGRFRPDLLYRLNTMTLTIPPLRDRPAEVEPLAESFLARACAQLDRAAAPALSGAARAMLRRHRWPGNVRELRNAMERAAVVCGGDEVLPEHLPAKIATGGAGAALPKEPGPPALQLEPPGEPLGPEEEAEKRRISDAIEQCAGNQTRAAKMLEISRRTLLNKLDIYGLPRPRKPG